MNNINKPAELSYYGLYLLSYLTDCREMLNFS